MKRARRLSGIDFSLCRLHQRLVRWTSLCVCFALVLSALAIVPFASATGKSRGRRISPTVKEGSQSGNVQERRVAPRPPQPGPPPGKIPNLDDR